MPRWSRRKSREGPVRHFITLIGCLVFATAGELLLVSGGLHPATVVAVSFGGLVIAACAATLVSRTEDLSADQVVLQRITLPVTPSQAPSASSYPRTRSGFVGGGISTSVSFSKPKRL